MRILIRLAFFLGLLSVIFYFFSSKKYSSIIAYEINRHENLVTKLQGTKVLDGDFQFLEHLLKDKKIILLGEQLHGDGMSQKIKSELILYLINQGYDVVFFESPLYKTEQNWNLVEKGLEVDFSKSLYKFWSRAQENQQLFDVIIRRINNKSPIYLSGIDYQYPISFSQFKITKTLKEYFKSYENFKIEDYNLLWDCFENRLGPTLYLNNSPNTIKKREKLPTVLKQVEKLENLIDTRSEKTRDDLFMKRKLHNIRHFFYAKANLNTSSQIQYRDSLMYENTKWLIDTIYPNKKVIIWAANAHLINDQSSRTMGAYLKKHFKNEVYTILFTSFQGATRNISNDQVQKVAPAIKGSIEYGLADKYSEVVYISADKNIRDSTSVMRFLGNRNINDRWFNKMDGFFFINTMHPITFTNGNF